MLAVCAGGLLAGAAQAQMVSPAIDAPGQPFSYFSQPVDEIGVRNAPSATEITPEGFLYTGFGELMFFTGPDQEPLAARIRTLEEGTLPIVSYGVDRLGVHYGLTAFAAQVGDASKPGTQPVVNFVHVALHNPGTEERTAFFTTAIRYQAVQTTENPTGDNRFRRPATAAHTGDYQQPGEPFKSDWSYKVGDGECLRAGRVLFLYPQQPAPQLSLTLHTQYNHIEPLASSDLNLQPTTPVCRVSYTVPLQPGETRTLDLRMPLIPVAAGSPEVASMAGLQQEAAHALVRAQWQAMLGRGMQIELPEAKPVTTFGASLVYDLLARNVVDGQYVQTVNQLQYHRFYLRDSADFIRMLDATGYSDIAAEDLSFYPSRQQADGNFLSQPGQYDGWGQTLWVLGEHYRRTHDQAFAAQVYPGVVRAVAWLQKARAADPLHLMPATDVRDNEFVPGHLTGYNFLALDGLQAAIELAQATGHPEDAARFTEERDAYRATFFKLLDQATAQNGGVLPPSLDIAADPKAWKGTDWGNLLAVTPEVVLNPMDPKVTATLASTQARYREGIMTYTTPGDGIFLHHYLTIKNTLTELVRGDQEQAIRELYAELLHTSSTQAGFEYAIRPWGARDFEGNLSPHGWFAADYRNLLRNMMVREQDGDLHLLSAISPEWLGAGKTIRVTHAPTYFGKLSFVLTGSAANAATLSIIRDWTHSPRQLVVHLPWFLTGPSAQADGKSVPVEQGAVRLPPNTHTVQIAWRGRLPVHMSYERTVASYEAEYRRHYAELLRSGQMPYDANQPDPWRVPE